MFFHFRLFLMSTFTPKYDRIVKAFHRMIANLEKYSENLEKQIDHYQKIEEEAQQNRAAAVEENIRTAATTLKLKKLIGDVEA